MKITKTLTTLKDILTPLFKIQESIWINQNPDPIRSNQALKTYKAVCEEWIPITFEEIESLFKRSELILDFSERKKVLYLPPLKKDSHFVPVLSLSCKLSETQSVAKFRVMLICRDKQKNLCGIGFRYGNTGKPESECRDTPTNAGNSRFPPRTTHSQVWAEGT